MFSLLLLLAACTMALKPEALPGIQPFESTTDNEQTISPGEIRLISKSITVKTLLVHGTLVVHPNPSSPLKIQAESIVVFRNGSFFCGTAESPVLGSVEIELVGVRTPNVSTYDTGMKSIGVRPGGLLRIHGKPIARSWTQLASTAAAGATSVTVTEAVSDWSVGSSIVISTTDFEDPDTDPNYLGPQSEVRKITAIDAAGTGLTLDRPLTFMHYAELYKPTADAPASHAIEMRAAVGLLSRNVVFHGNNTDDGWGAHMLFLEGSDFQVHDIEIHSAGQARELGRYPLHAHLAGVAKGSFVGNSIHDTHQRCITIHGTQKLLVSGNTCFRPRGHGVFIEDGNEEDNIVAHNLVVQPLKHTLLGSDSEPACYWITNAHNHFFNNRAVGGAFGFWFAMPLRPTGFGKKLDGPQWMLRFQPMGDFRGNVANSAGTGVFVDRGQEDDQGNARQLTSYTPRDYTKSLEFIDDAAMAQLMSRSDYEKSEFGVPVLATFADLTLFKNGDAFWYRGDYALVTNSKFADNVAAFTAPGNDNILQNSIVIGESNNVGTPVCTTCPNWSPSRNQGERARFTRWWLDRPIFGFRTYDAAGGDLCLGVTFYNFNDYKFDLPNLKSTRSAGAISGLTGPNVIDATTLIMNSKFVNVQNRVFLTRFTPGYDQKTMTSYTNDLRELDDAMRGWAVVDYDGTITGDCGATIVGTSAHVNEGCTERPGWNAWVCKSSDQRVLRSLQIRSDQLVSGSVPAVRNDTAGRLTNLRTGAAVTIDPDRKDYYEGATTEEYYLRYGTNVITNTAYSFAFGRKNEPLRSFVAQVSQLTVGEAVRVAFPFAAGTTFAIKVQYGDDMAKPAASLAALSFDTPYFFGDNMLWLHFETRDRDWHFRGGSPHYPQLTSYWRFVVTVNNVQSASLASFDFVGRARAANASPTTPVSALVDAKLCGKNGPAPINGVVSFTRTDTDELPIISGGKFSERFSIWSKACNTTTTADEPAVLCNFALKDRYFGGGAPDWMANWKYDNPSTFTHVLVRAKSVPGFGHGSLGIRFVSVRADMMKGIAEQGSRSIDVASPLYNAGGFLVEEEWLEFYVPLQDLQFVGVQKLLDFAIFNYQVRPYQVLITDVKFVKATRAIVPATGFPSLIPVPARRSSYDPNKKPVVPGDPSMPMPNCVAGSAGCVCGAASMCASAALACAGGVCVNACSRSRVLGCGCSAGELCADGLTCSPAQVCFDAAVGCAKAGAVGCECDAGGKCSDSSVSCIDNVCKIATCASGDLGCSCKADGTCSGADTKCADGAFCVTAAMDASSATSLMMSIMTIVALSLL
jgi:hypothetical protein